ncbi:hypothetical protein [Mesorhizobium sp. B2-4-17]|uniref:hypothetical protein n=1 Tax=Mesorhizobium sp. B2-4-17 TaxID=2589932 RepID=UPI00112B4B6A|nr:hypothetical protein [Mesorhizobium sp. B2-4-17]TPK78205.1 hypothetical protein FJ548_25055 [Mesorhizobium sp. B2-4-17]
MHEWDTDEYRAAQRAAYEAIKARHPDLVTRGFGCYAGWLPILARFFDTVAEVLADAPGVGFQLSQVKEKFGGLRIYYVVPRRPLPRTLDTQAVREADAHRKISEAYERAEQEANRTCDVCGKAGVLRVRNGWFATRCEEHADGTVPVAPKGEMG